VRAAIEPCLREDSLLLLHACFQSFSKDLQRRTISVLLRTPLLERSLLNIARVKNVLDTLLQLRAQIDRGGHARAPYP